MPLYLDSFKNNPPECFNTELQIKGVESFRKSLEKYFFSEVTVRNNTSHNTGVTLAIDLECNLSLVEMLFHFNRGTWGNFLQGKSSFKTLIRQLREENQFNIDVKELSMLFKDTRIIVNKIYSRSIPEQLENIFSAMGKHYVHFSKGLTETPYEIYVPVFEERNDENEILLRNIEDCNHSKKDYFKYWAIYFDSEDDAVIYNLEESHLENGDLFMLNH